MIGALSGIPGVQIIDLSDLGDRFAQEASGGIFGPEASLPAIVVGLAVFVATWLGARRRGLV